MEQTIPQAKPKRTGKIILIVVLAIIIVFGTFIVGFAAGAVYITWQDSDWNVLNSYEPYYDDGDCDGSPCVSDLKPAIYLYPTTSLAATVRLNYDGEIITDIPQYDAALGGWQVTAEPDGTLTIADGLQYPYLFWEGKPTDPRNKVQKCSGFLDHVF